MNTLIIIVVGIVSIIPLSLLVMWLQNKSNAGKKSSEHSTVVFIYPNGKVYHKTKFCSDSQSIPYQISEKEAIAKGLHQCEKCW